MITFRKPRKKDSLEGLRESHMKNLMVLSEADGHLAEIEEHLVMSIALRLGLTEDDVARIRADIDNISFVLPEKYDDRIEQFTDLLTLVAIDGVIDPNEERYIRKIARKYELMEQQVEELIQQYL